MPSSPEDVIKLYEGSLRALDTKSQIFLAFMAITITPVFTRLGSMGLPTWLQLIEGVLVALSTLAFVYCLFPRRGTRSVYGLFDTKLSGKAVAERLRNSGYEIDGGESVAVLHDIYRVKSASVAVGTLFVAIYIVSVALAFALS